MGYVMKTPTLIIIPFALACFALSPQARAVCQEGCLTNDNTVLGDDALISNTTGFDNTAVGWEAMELNTTGFNNAAFGWLALFANRTGSYNTGVGFRAITALNGGVGNTAVGSDAMNTSDFNGLTGSFNIALGYHAGSNLTSGDYNIDIGNEGVAGESSTIRIGTVGTQTATYIAGIREAEFARGTAVAVGITADGQLGVRASSARFNEAIQPMDEASEAILSLKPVTFRYKHELDPENIPQFGLVAEDVEKVNPDLVARDKEGKPYTVRYEEVNAMLLNEFLKEHKKVEEQAKEIVELKAELKSRDVQTKAQLQELTARLDAKGL